MKQIINTWKITTLETHQNTYRTLIWIIWYGWSMSGYLPCGGFKWLRKVDKFDVNSIGEKSLIGYIFQADLEYPDELHVLHNDYPLAPEKLAIPYNMLSDNCKQITDEYGIKVGQQN